jgi:hypothetical protein
LDSRDDAYPFFYASPSLNILPTGVPSVANYKVLSSKYIFDKVDAVAPYYVSRHKPPRNEPFFFSDDEN